MRRGWGILLAFCVTGCAWSAPGVSPHPGEGSPQTVVANSGQAGDRAITINLLDPAEGGFRTQATVHRWTDADIFQYEVTLKVGDGTTFTDLPTPLQVVVPRKESPKTRAVFTNLKQGKAYQVAVIAKGNVGGTAPDVVLNAVPATATFDFTATQDVEDTVSADLRVVFDAVAFNGSGSTNLLTPEDGSYRNPTAPESGVAQ